MDTNIVFVSDHFEQVEGQACQLLKRILAPLDAVIELVAVKVDHNMALPLATFDFHCTVLLKTKDGATIRAEARDCDDILVVYRAISKIIDQLPLAIADAGYDLPERFGEPTAGSFTPPAGRNNA